MFEILTLVQTRKMTKKMPVILFGKAYWSSVINFQSLVENATISERDLQLFHATDSVDDAYEWVVRQLTEHALGQPGAVL